MDSKLKKVNKIITNIVRVFIIILSIFMIYKENYDNLGILILTMLLTFYEIIIEKCFKIELSEKLKISLTIFIFSAQVLGTVLDFYGKFSWWDTMLHTVSGIIFFLVGETLIKQINKKTTDVNISLVIIILFSICFSLTTGVIWEVFEFFIDTTLGQNMQITEGLYGRNAILDTMIDLISLIIGTIFITIINIYIEKKNKGKCFE